MVGRIRLAFRVSGSASAEAPRFRLPLRGRVIFSWDQSTRSVRLADFTRGYSRLPPLRHRRRIPLQQVETVTAQ